MTCKHLLQGAPDCVFCHRDQLQHELRLADEGLANYQQHIQELTASLSTAIADYERLRKILTQAPIAKVTVEEDCPANVLLYAPGLPPGEYDLYLQTEEIPAQHPTAPRENP